MDHTLGVSGGMTPAVDLKGSALVPCLLQRGQCGGLARERGPGPRGCSVNNTDIHPRQALALLVSEGGAG